MKFEQPNERQPNNWRVIVTNLQAEIRDIVHDNSGGVKFLALLADLASRRMDIGLGEDSVEVIMDAIKLDPSLRIHGYVWHMDGPNDNTEGVSRTKMFVYQV